MLNTRLGEMLFLKPYRKIAKVIIHISKTMMGITMLINNNPSNPPLSIKIKLKIVAMKPPYSKG
ncbi:MULTISPECIES: hypothetical protein [Campylobacter]|uniref:Uncharacterized protein n=1 Tax=Campylobacter porcelli TaxID=1660073 RepID=A0ABU7M564_9BACT|nr:MULTISPECIES: hypothetical protein [unclassified Campylobacter]MCR8696499.1 hypothetical protein [Campylobacter sp. RM19073]MEE3703967.1 hypothetical protein [Campylobacter sp. CX2-8023-23]MEE3744861.1 hypothetical protein [Campylobacter sp. CX2-4855-23]